MGRVLDLQRRSHRGKLAGDIPDIEVDGNITKENIGAVAAAGATIFVSGRAIVKGNMEENIRWMQQEIRKGKEGKQT